jgi:probable HAF family extracellular repeat protein
MTCEVTADGINDSRQVAGVLNYWVGFLWENGVRTNLGHLGCGGSFPSDINNAGQIVGSSGRTDPDTYETTYRAFLYSDGAMTQIPVPSFDAYAGDINDHGVVVGTMRTRRGLP